MDFIMLYLNIIFTIILIVSFKHGSCVHEIEEVYEEVPSCSYTGESSSNIEENNNYCYETLKMAGFIHNNFTENYTVIEKNEEFNRALEESKNMALYSDIVVKFHNYMNLAATKNYLKLNPHQFCYVYTCAEEIQTHDHQQIMTQYQLSDDLKSKWDKIKNGVKKSFGFSPKQKMCRMELCLATLQRNGYNMIGYKKNDTMTQDNINANQILENYHAYINENDEKKNLGYLSWCTIERCTEEIEDAELSCDTANDILLKATQVNNNYYIYEVNQQSDEKYAKKYKKFLMEENSQTLMPFQFCTYQVCLDDLKTQGFKYKTFQENHSKVFMKFNLDLKDISKDYLEFSLAYLEQLIEFKNPKNKEKLKKGIKNMFTKKEKDERDPVPFCLNYFN